MAPAHQNLSEYAGSLNELYRIWDDDLRRCSSRRQWTEYAGMACLAGSLAAYGAGYPQYALGIGYFAVNFLYVAIKYMTRVMLTT